MTHQPSPLAPTVSAHPPVRWRAWLRLGMYLFTLCVGVAALGLLAARAEARRGLGRFGESLLGTLEPVFEGGGHSLSVNGMRLELAMLHTDSSLDAVLDGFEAACSGHPPEARCDGPEAVAADTDCHSDASAPTSLPDWARALEEPGRLFVLRHQERGEGHLVCLAQPPGRDLRSTLEAVEAFVETGDLAQIGPLRYVVANPTARGTQVRVVWSEGPLRLAALFPESGDAPGRDLPDVPRPERSVRRLSARVLDAPFGLGIYSGLRSPRAWVAFYDRALSSAGWERLPGLDERLGGGGLARAYLRDGRAVLVGAQPGSEGETFATVLDMGFVARGQHNPLGGT